MRKLKKFLSVAITYIFAINLVLQGVPNIVSAETSNEAVKPLNAVNGQVVFQLKDEKNNDYLKILQKYDGKILSKNGQDILLQVDNGQVQNAIGDLQKDSNVLFAEVNALGKKQGSVLPAGNYSSFVLQSNASEAWSLLPAAANQTQVTVAVVDSGVKASHPALSGKVLAGYNYVSNNSVTDDDNGHGTEVAGIIAANNVNDSGVIGVTGAANVKILPVKVLDSNGDGTSYNVAQGIKYAANNGANIINVSIAGQGYSKEIEDAINTAQSKNCLVICSAGDYNDHTENYWPCNCDGTVVVSNSFRGTRILSNYGKEVTFGEAGAGETTTMDGAYGYVFGSSFSAAMVSGIAALGKIQYPKYTAIQIENAMKNAVSAGSTYNHYTGFGSIDAYKLMNTSNSLIEIQSPASGLNSNGDVSLKVAAIVPSTISKLEVYLNDAAAPATTITGNSSSSYTYTIPAASLVDGANKIAVKAYSTSEATYTDFRYIREYKTNEHQFSLKFTDLNGNPLSKGTRIFLQKDGDSNTVSDLTDSNGAVTFYNTNLDTKYNVSYQYNNYDSNNVNHPVFFRAQVNSSSIPSVIDSSSLRKVTLSAKKADGTALLASKLYYGNGLYGQTAYTDVFDGSGNGSIYVTDAANDKIKLVNESQGYLLEKAFPQGMYGITSINFAVDNTVTKVNISNTSYSGISSQLFSVLSTDDFNNYKLHKLSVNNNAVYLSKGMDYQYYYEANITSSGKTYSYDYTLKDAATNSSSLNLNYGKPHVDLTQSTNTQDSALDTRLNVSDDNGNSLFINSNNQITYDLNDSNSQLIKEQVTAPYGKTASIYNEFSMDSVPTGSYTLSGKVDLGPLGVITGTPANINYTQGTSGSATTSAIKVSIKAPVSTMTNYSVSYDIYDNSSGKIAYSGYASYDTASGSATASIDKSYFSSNYSIAIDGYSNFDNTQRFTFLYNRSMPSVPSSSIVIDNSSNTAKQITLKTDDSTKQNVINTGILLINLSAFPQASNYENLNYTIDTNGVTSLYADKGNYDFQLRNFDSKYWLFNAASISDSSSTVIFSTSNLAKLTVTANNLTNYTGSSLTLVSSQNQNSSFAINLDKGSVFNISPLLNTQVKYFTLKAFDNASGKSYTYGYSCYSNPITINKDTDIKLDDFTFKFNSSTSNVSLPNSITANYSITSGGYTLSNINCSDKFDFMNEFKNDKYYSNYFNLYNVDNTLVKSTKYNPELGSASASYASISDSSLASGTYTAAIELPAGAANITGNSFTVKVDSSSIQKIHILNPFDTSKPADNAKVYIGSETYNADIDGDIYVNKSDIKTAADITVSVESLDSQSTAIYSPDSITADSNGCINVNKSISALDKLQIATSDSSNKFNFSDGNVNVGSSNRSYSTKLNYNGQKNIYLPQGSYSIDIDNLFDNTDTGYLFIQGVNLTGSQTVNFDTSKMACVSVNSNNQSYNLNFNYTVEGISNSSYVNDDMSAIYVSSGNTINYQYTSNNINGTGSFTTVANGTNTINIGKSYSLSAALDSAALGICDTISASIAVSDEYKNNLSISNLYNLTAVISQNGNAIDTLNCSGSSNGKYTFNLNGDIAGSASVHFVEDLGSLGKITTADIPIDISSDGYYALSITDPLGKPAASGNVQIGTLSDNYLNVSSNVSINKNGTAFVKKSSLSGSENKIVILGSTADTKDPYIYYRDFNKNTTSYAATNTKAINVKTNITGIQYPDANLYVSCGNVKFNTALSISSDKYSKFNLYVDKGTYNISYEINDWNYSNNSEYHLIKRNIDSSIDNSIEFDNTSISKVEAVYDGKLSTSGKYFNLSDDNLNINGSSVATEYYTKADYDEVYADVYFNNGQGLSFTRKNFTVKDDVTEIHFGKELVSTNDTVYSDGFDSCITAGDTISLGYQLKDTEGFTTFPYGSYIVNFSQNGSLVQSVNSGSYSNQITVPALAEGFYNVDVYYLDSQSGVKLESKKVYVGTSASSFININGSSIFPYLSHITIYDGTNQVYDGDKANEVPNILNTSKTYTAYITGYGNADTVTEIYPVTLSYNSDNSEWLSSSSNIINFNITNAKGMLITVKDSRGRTSVGSANNDGSFYIDAAPGAYNINFKGTGADGNYYDFNRSVTVSSDNTSYAVDYSNLCKVSITNNYTNTPSFGSYIFTKTDKSSSFSVDDNDVPGGTIYTDKGSYNAQVSKLLRGAAGAVTGTYALDCTGTSAVLALGSKLSASVTLDKASYNAGEVPTISSVSVSDGGTVLSGFSNSDFGISGIDVMHGATVIKSFSGFVPGYLKGECELRVNLNNSLAGISKVQPVTINNAALTVDGDINLDGIVDIYDLVLLSKDMGKTKAGSADWDGRCNLDNSDNLNKIDIKDLAKAAQNYNSRY